ncbi:hypothetical protein FXO38_17200 [Capsicum annuum]|nr:hypothetical protein FXO38_17200 [Capsicum annuum]
MREKLEFEFRVPFEVSGDGVLASCLDLIHHTGPAKLAESLQQTPTTEERKNLTVSAIAAILTNLSEKCEKQGCGLEYPTYHMKKMTEISIETENMRCCVLKIYMARVIYVYVLTVDGVPTINFDPDLLRTRDALMLWHHGSRKEEEKAQSDDKAPMRPPRNIGIT